MQRPLRSLALLASAVLAAAVLPLAGPTAGQADDAAFRALPDFTPSGDRVRVAPEEYAAVRVDTAQLRADLAASGVVSVPTPAGGVERFEVVPTQVMAPGLAAAHPEIRTWAGHSLDHPGSTIALDVTPLGFHASVRGAGGQHAWYVDPAYDGRGTTVHLAYDGSSLPEPAEEFVEGELPDLHGDDHSVAERRLARSAARADGPVEQRVYRLALLSDTKYAQYFGAENVVAEKVTLINRVNQIYNDDLAINLQLIDGTEELSLDTRAAGVGANGPCGAKPCFDLADKDKGYPGDLETCWPGTLDRMPAVLGQLVGASAYDVGHIVLGRDGGGLANLGAVGTATKAKGCTGLSEPVGDVFAVDYVAHELGHQFAGSHTFEGVEGSCGSGGQRMGRASVEPGSGSSVMAYAGICGLDDLQPHTDPYFSQRTISEVTAFAGREIGPQVEVQNVSLRGFGADGDTIALGYDGSAPVTLTRGVDYDADGIEAAVEQVTGTDVTIARWGWDAGDTLEPGPAPLGEPDDGGFTVVFADGPDTANAASDRVDMTALDVTSITPGVTAEVGESVRGGAPTNGGEVVTTANQAPVVTAPAPRTLPIRTPFTLTGSATDADGDVLTYIWEQNDTGGARGTALLSNERKDGPLFRVFGRAALVSPEDAQQSPSPGQNTAGRTGTRTFPDLRQVLRGNTNARTGRCPAVRTPKQWTLRKLDCYSEFLPVKGYVGTAGSKRAAMHFRLTARDAAPGGGGVGSADVTLRLDRSAGPFLVDSFGTKGTRVDGGSKRVIRWQVNGTRPLASHVSIVLSTDNGRTWDRVLAAKTENDGRQRVRIPDVRAARAWIMVRAVDNYFFDTNDRAFRIR